MKKEEKELTNEATIDSLKEMAIKLSQDTYACRVLANAINIIQGLQNKNERLKRQVLQGLRDMKLEVGIRDKEIERLNGCVMSEEQIRKCCADIIQETRVQTVKDTTNKVYKGLCERKNWNEMKEANLWGNDSEELKALISKIVGVEVE